MNSSELSAADIAAVTGNNNGGLFGGDGSWLAILFLFALFGWGRGGFGGGGFGGGGCTPCATQADVRAAVDQQTLISKLDNQTYGLSDSTYALNNTINNGFHGVDMCCCETQRLIERGFADTNYNLATQFCETRNAIHNSTRDIVDNQNCNTRAILDFLVQDKLATKDARIAQLENKLSQADQNAVLRAAIDASTAEIIRRTGNECPMPAYLVNGPTPINFPVNGCGQVQFGNGWNGGCGGNGFN